ncbi:hypothetical protein SAMD00020551_0062 [Mesobacillus selenatarsenatis SF-1]|uniref:Uncharacterized protein n=1 Tax=Mesobacillus selenatarsenatis (strain DSM 18680 / JCM 14380 / FERM P-15431 / SF-1) TaxID=1321606 RepID=A0A0A8WYD6_MESS1|nr:hypothetical protein SAMD00020551_0062 [Mesobacillus selenatarsenatis SF-1]
MTSLGGPKRLEGLGAGAGQIEKRKRLGQTRQSLELDTILRARSLYFKTRKEAALTAALLGKIINP